MSTNVYKIALFTVLSTAFTGSIFAQDATSTEPESSKFCTYSKRMPIIPDGNIATKDELVSAKERITEYQDHLNDYRDCLYRAETALDQTASDYEEQKSVIQKLSEESIAVEQKVADKFNQAIRIYRDR